MKMIYAIVSSDDGTRVTDVLTENHFSVTRLATTGGFLKKGNATLMIGTEAEKVDQAAKVDSVTASKSHTEAAKAKNTGYNRAYTTTSGLRLRAGAGTNKDIILTIPKGEKVRCYGYHTTLGDTVWLYVAYKKYTGFASKKYLK